MAYVVYWQTSTPAPQKVEGEDWYLWSSSDLYTCTVTHAHLPCLSLSHTRIVSHICQCKHIILIDINMYYSQKCSLEKLRALYVLIVRSGKVKMLMSCQLNMKLIFSPASHVELHCFCPCDSCNCEHSFSFKIHSVGLKWLFRSLNTYAATWELEVSSSLFRLQAKRIFPN